MRTKIAQKYSVVTALNENLTDAGTTALWQGRVYMDYDNELARYDLVSYEADLTYFIDFGNVRS